MLKDKHITALCREAENFVAEKLAPMLEEMTGETGGDDFKKNLFATMMTVGTEIPAGGLKIAKKGDKFVIIKRGAGGDDAEEEEEDDEEEEKSSAKDEENAMGEEMSALVAKVVRSAKKHAKGKDDYEKILAATAATIAEVGGEKAVQITKMHLSLDIDDIIKGILDL